MIRALHTAATGMLAQQMKIDVIGNNIANVSTSGFKKDMIEFQTLLYQTLLEPGAQVDQGTTQASGIQIGLGTKTSAITKNMMTGTLINTNDPLNVAVEGIGFFQIQQNDGTTAYTRDGSFKIDASGQLVTSDGFIVQPSITIPENAKEITITADGRISVSTPGAAELTEVGTLELARFPNDAGLLSIGKNLFTETAASGSATTGTPGQEGLGFVQQGFLEGSNVQIVEELINLIAAQRAFETNSKVITASNEALRTTNQIL